MTSHRSSASSFTDTAALPEATRGPAPYSPEWLSSFMDGETERESGPLPDVLHSAAGRADWDTYHLIGDVLRTPELSHLASAGFQARLVAALEQEAPIIAAPRPHAKRFMTRYGLPGLAAAAAVASVTWMAQPYFGEQPSRMVEFSAQAGMGMPAGNGIAQVSVSSPQAAQAEGGGAPEMSLSEYLNAHLQISGRGAIRQVSATSSDRREGQR